MKIEVGVENREWQHMGEDEWVFGVKVRGIIRHSYADIYFDEDLVGFVGTNGGWVWMVSAEADGVITVRGTASSFTLAVASCEKALGVS